MTAIIDDLKLFSIPTAVLSNWPQDLFHHAVNNIPLILELGPRIVSGEVGLTKPDRRIFRLLLDRLASRPQDIIFVDDNVDNIEVALSLGIDAIQFTSASVLRTEFVLRRLIPHDSIAESGVRRRNR